MKVAHGEKYRVKYYFPIRSMQRTAFEYLKQVLSQHNMGRPVHRYRKSNTSFSRSSKAPELIRNHQVLIPA